MSLGLALLFVGVVLALVADVFVGFVVGMAGLVWFLLEGVEKDG